MGCDEIRDVISAELDGDAAPDEVRAAIDHVAGCGECARWSAEARRIHRAMAAARQAVPPVTPLSTPALARPSSRRRLAVFAAAAVPLLAVAGVVAVSREQHPPPALRSMSGVAAAAGPAESTRAYLTIVNEGGEDHLVAASSSVARRVVLHEQRLTGMAADEAYRIEPDSTTEQSPGGAHLMLEDLRRVLQPGDQVDVVLRFDRAGPVTLTLDVVATEDEPEG